MRGDGWIKTYTGKKFWPLDPRADEVDIHDIAHALSMQCRFGGHTRHFYSVAQHSVLVSDYVSRELAIYGLLHDAAEAYLIDLPSPIKKDVMVRKAIRPIEDRLTRIIAKAFDLETAKFYHPEVKKADMVLLATEARDFMDVERPPPTEAWGVEAPMPKNIIAWSQMQAKRAFLQTFRKLQKA